MGWEKRNWCGVLRVQSGVTYAFSSKSKKKHHENYLLVLNKKWQDVQAVEMERFETD